MIALPPEGIPCSICGKMILDRDTITLWSQHNMHNAPPYARVIIPHNISHLDHAYVIGCTDPTCMRNNKIRGKLIHGRIHLIERERSPFGIILWTRWLDFLAAPPLAQALSR